MASNGTNDQEPISRLRAPDGKVYKVALIGSGNWGSAIATIIGSNVKRYSHFDDTIKMYVFEEQVNGKNLTEIINETHENVKYLPGIKLPESIVAVPDVVDAAQDADILIVAIPHQFVPRICAPLKGKLKDGAFAISLNKVFGEKEGSFVLVSDVIEDVLGVPCSLLMGANLANEVAKGDSCEFTIGCRDVGQGSVLKDLFHTDNFLVTVFDGATTIQVYDALDKVFNCAARILEGLGLSDNTKSAVMKQGVMEESRFCRLFNLNGTIQTNESAEKLANGFADDMALLEEEMSDEKKLQGPEMVRQVYEMLKDKNLTNKFPLFVAVHMIATKEILPSELISRLRLQPSDD